MSESDYAELARLGTATVYEGGGRRGLIDAPLHQVVPGTRVAGPARNPRCAECLLESVCYAKDKTFQS